MRHGLWIGSAAVGAGWLVTATERTTYHGGCGWDGARYCAMLAGRLVEEPYSRRVLPVALAWPLAELGLSAPTAFLLVDMIAILAAAWLAVVLMIRLIRVSRATATPFAIGFVVLFVVLHPATIRTAVAAPPLSDQLALAFLMGTLVLLTSRRPWLAAFPAVGAVMAREAFGVVILAAAISVVFVNRRALVSGVVVAASALAATLFVLTRPHAPGEYDTLLAILSTAKTHVESPIGWTRLVWNIVIGVGLTTIALWIQRHLWLRRMQLERYHIATPVLIPLVLAAVANGGLALVGGYDTARLLLPTGVIFAVIVAAGIRVKTEQRTVAVLAVATFILWRPWVMLGPDFFADFVPFISPQQDADPMVTWTRVRVDVLIIAAAVVAAIAASHPTTDDTRTQR